MPNDTYTTLNPGAGGDFMDETAVTYGGAPTTRKRPRVVIGDDAGNLTPLLTTTPSLTELALPIRPIQGFISTNNSSTATLTANSTFTGTADDISNFSSIYVSVFSDQNSATGGIKLEFSQDNTNWDIIQPWTVLASTSYDFHLHPKAKYFRVVYTNGGTGQGAFRLQTILKMSPRSGLEATTTPQLTFATINISSSGDNTVVAGVSGKIIRIYRMLMLANSSASITFKDGASTSLTGPMLFGGSGGMVLDFQEEPWFTTSATNDFIINLSSAVQVSGSIYYIQS